MEDSGSQNGLMTSTRPIAAARNSGLNEAQTKTEATWKITKGERDQDKALHHQKVQASVALFVFFICQ